MRYIIEDDWLVVEHNNMSLTKDEVDIIKISWRPVLEDPKASGILLFKELFTKFPDYLNLFPKFRDMNVNELQNNKRLVAHASKVIDTVTAIIAMLADEDKSEILTEALQSTAKSHLGRNIGVDKFKNLGIVLIDFICQINHRYQGDMKQLQQRLEQQPLVRQDLTSKDNTTTGATTNSNTDNIQDNTDSHIEKGYLSLGNQHNIDTVINTEEGPGKRQLNGNNGNMIVDELGHKMTRTSLDDEDDGVDVCHENDAKKVHHLHYNDKNQHHRHNDHLFMRNVNSSCIKHNVDTNRLVAAWTKLYACILDTVQSESDRWDKLPKGDSKEDEDVSNASSQFNPSSSSSLDDDSMQPL